MRELTKAQLKVVRYIVENSISNGRSTDVSELAESMGQTLRHMRRVVKRLVNAEYVRATPATPYLIVSATKASFDACMEWPIGIFSEYYSLYIKHRKERGSHYHQLSDSSILQKVALSIGAMRERGFSIEEVKEYVQEGIDNNDTRLLEGRI